MLKRKTITRKKTYPKRRQLIGTSGVTSYLGRSNLQELKCRDQYFSPGTVVNTAGVAYVTPTVAGNGLATGYTCISLLEQGNGASQRIGEKVVIKSIKISGTIYAADNAAATDLGVVRVAMIYDAQPNGAAPAYGDIFSDLNTDNSYTNQFNSGTKLANQKRFKLLADKKYPIAYADSTCKFFKIYKKFKCTSRYQSTANPPTIANVTSGAIFFMIWSTASYVNYPEFTGITCRIRYWD